MDDIYKVFAPFAENHRQQHMDKPLFFVSLDISGCFDNLDHAKVMGVCQQLLCEDEYQIRRYTSVMMSNDELRIEFKRDADVLDSADFFSEFATDLAASGKYWNTVLTDQVMYFLHNKEEILHVLRKHICCNIVQANGKFYHQKVGIPQGSVLSTLLCSLYLGAVENQFIQLSEESVLMRMVDDFLLISRSQEEAERFYYGIEGGLVEFNCSVNAVKTLMNFNAGFGPDSFVTLESFPWCGICFNTETLEVQIDFARYEGIHLSDCLTVDCTSHPFLNMKRHLLQFLKGKCHPIFLDEAFNSNAIVRENVYQLGYVVAMKMVVYLRELPSSCVQYFSVKNLTDMLSEFSGHFIRVAQVKYNQV
jgi:telomerase reverse transcriptase